MFDVAEALHTYGGWAVAAACMIVIWKMWTYITRLHAERQAESKAAIEAQREETRATVTALIETREALRAFKGAMETLAHNLEGG
jgi:hypothetical protein